MEEPLKILNLIFEIYCLYTGNTICYSFVNYTPYSSISMAELVNAGIVPLLPVRLSTASNVHILFWVIVHSFHIFKCFLGHYFF